MSPTVGKKFKSLSSVLLLLPLPRVLGRLFVPDLPADPFQVSLLLLGEGVVGGEGDPLLLTQLPLLLVQVEPRVLTAHRLTNQTPLCNKKERRCRLQVRFFS